MVTAEELNKRLLNVVHAAKACKIPVSDLSAEELEEVGLLTIRFADIEETVALDCEILLLRPELGGFHSYAKSVLTRQFSEKLNLFRSLIVASGTLWDIETKPVEKTLAGLKRMGEDRNTIVHGFLGPDRNGQICFSGRGRNLEANLQTLRSLTEVMHTVEVELVTNFLNFYRRLVAKRSTHSSVEAAFEAFCRSDLTRLNLSNKTRNDFLQVRATEGEWIAASRKASQSRETQKRAQKQLRNAKARLRRLYKQQD